MVNKYGARAYVGANGQRFDSRREMSRYRELELMQAAGVISGLEAQVPFELEVNGVKICRYVADAVYSEDGGLTTVVEDTKSKPTRTQAYVLKRKLMLACHGIAIREVE